MAKQRNTFVIEQYEEALQAHSDGAIATAICLSQLIGYTRFSVTVPITLCEHLHRMPYNPSVVIKKLLQSSSHSLKRP